MDAQNGLHIHKRHSYEWGTMHSKDPSPMHGLAFLHAQLMPWDTRHGL